jgi:hypothetical protein
MKIALEEIEQVIDSLSSATMRAKEARRVAKKVYGDQKEISIQLKYAYEDLQKAVKILEMQG